MQVRRTSEILAMVQFRPAWRNTLTNTMGGIVKRSLAMVLSWYGETIAKACGLDDATPQPVGVLPDFEPSQIFFIFLLTRDYKCNMLTVTTDVIKEKFDEEENAPNIGIRMARDAGAVGTRPADGQ